MSLSFLHIGPCKPAGALSLSLSISLEEDGRDEKNPTESANTAVIKRNRLTIKCSPNKSPALGISCRLHRIVVDLSTDSREHISESSRVRRFCSVLHFAKVAAQSLACLVQLRFRGSS